MFNCGQTITQESIFEPKTNSICGSVHVQDRMRASAMRARLTLHIWNSDAPKWTVTELTITIGWVLNKKKQTKMFARGKGLLLSLSLSIPVKQQQPNKSQTYSMTNSRLWHPSDPKHVLIISPWLPVGVYVISTHIPSGKISIHSVAWNQSDTGLGGLEWSSKTYEGIQKELPCSQLYTVFPALVTQGYISKLHQTPH